MHRQHERSSIYVPVHAPHKDFNNLCSESGIISSGYLLLTENKLAILNMYALDAHYFTIRPSSKVFKDMKRGKFEAQPFLLLQE
jgi:hypothetical protein